MTPARVLVVVILAATCGGCADPQDRMRDEIEKLERITSEAEESFVQAESGQAQAARELAELKVRLRRLVERLDRLAPEAAR